MIRRSELEKITKYAEGIQALIICILSLGIILVAFPFLGGFINVTSNAYAENGILGVLQTVINAFRSGGIYIFR